MTKNSAIVVGGGLAGLTAGYYLRKSGWDVTLVEAAERVGGRVQTVRRGGYVLDNGATQLSTGYCEYLALSDELGIRSEVVESSSYVGVIRRGRIHLIDGRNILKAPFTRLISLRGKWALLRTIRDFIALKPSVDARDVSQNYESDTESTAVYAARRVGTEVFEALMDPLVRAYVMNRGTNVSVLEWFSTLRILSGQTMLSMNAGNDVMPHALASKLDVRLATRATSIRRHGDEVVVETLGAAGGETLRAGACVLATRLPEAIALYAPVRAIAGRLGEIARYNRGLVIHLGYSRRPDNPAVGLLLSAVEHNEIGLIWLEHNKNADRAPPGHSLFSVYFDEAVADTCYSLPNTQLVAISSAYVEKLFPELAGYRDFDNVTRWPLGCLNPAPGVYREVHAMKSRLDLRDPVQLAGDYFTCVGQNSAVYYGKVAAETLLARGHAVRSESAA